MTTWQEIVLPEDGKLADLVLLKGRHDAREKGVCVMEAVAWLAGEQHTDHPACACPVIATFARRLNDTVDDADRQRLREFIPQLVGSKATREVEIRRGFVAADYVVRVITPLALEACGRPDLAKRLLDCAPIIDKATAIAARDVSHEVRRAAAAVDVANYAYAAAAAAYADAAAYAAYADAAAATDAVAAVAAAYATDAAAADAAAYARAGVLKENIKEARFQLLRVLLEVRA